MPDNRTKRCHTCGEDLPIGAFSTNGSPKDRVTPTSRPNCRPCDTARKRLRRIADPAWAEQERERKQRAYTAHPTADRATSRAWQRANRARVNAHNRLTAKARREADPERAKAKGRADARLRKLRRNHSSMAYARILLADPCAYCGAPGGTIDHIEPLRAGENNGWENLTAACLSCNAAKRDHPLLFFLGARAGFWPAVRPGYWSDHDASSADGAAP